MASTCMNTADPLFMWIQHNFVSAGETAAPAWGISLYLGEPAQPFSVRPTVDDFSLVALAEGCSGPTDYPCIARRGGVYDPTLSSSSVNVTNINAWNGSIGGYDDSFYQYHNDLLTFGWNDTEVFGFPFTTDDATLWATRNWLGLGYNSTFLKEAVARGAAPTKSWGLWTGSRSIKNPQDGLLMLGGYDQARKRDEWTEFLGLTDCPTCVQIKDIQWVTSTNTTSLFNRSIEAIQVSLDPWYDQIRFPQGVWENFGKATNGTYNDTLGYFAWAAGRSPQGSLRVTLQNGYVSEIPPEEIFTQPRYYNDAGEYVVSDNSTEYALVLNYTNTESTSNTVGAWGLPFLTMNYLVMDIEQKKFRMSPAIRQDFGNEGGVFPVPLCTGLAEPTTTPTPTPPTTSTPPPSSSSAAASGSGTRVGPIVGGVVGGVGGLALIGLLTFFLLRRRSKAKMEAEIANSSAYPPPPGQQMQHYQSPPPGPYSPTHSYPSPAFGHPGHNSMGFAAMPVPGYGGPQSDYSNEAQHSGPQFYSPSPSTKPEHASAVYSDTPTAVPELATPGQQVPNDWRNGSSVGEPAKDMQATVSRPFDSSWQEGPHQR